MIRYMYQNTIYAGIRKLYMYKKTKNPQKVDNFGFFEHHLASQQNLFVWGIRRRNLRIIYNLPSANMIYTNLVYQDSKVYLYRHVPVLYSHSNDRL